MFFGQRPAAIAVLLAGLLYILSPLLHPARLTHPGLRREGSADEESFQPRTLAKRGKSYEIDALEGSTLNGLLTGSESGLPEEYASKWETYSDVEKYGWVKSSDAHVLAPSVKAALDGLKLPPVTHESWEMIVWSHNKATTIVTAGEITSYPATGAMYKNLFNCERGVLIAVNNEGPGHVKNSPPPENLVPLKEWSDIQALQWQETCKGCPLRYVIQSTVRSGETLRHLHHIYGVSTFERHPLDQSPLTGFTGRKFQGNSEQGEAIIGSPNGRGVAFLLYQHKTTFGDKTYIKNIGVWDADSDIPALKETSGRANILFELAANDSTGGKRDSQAEVAGERTSSGGDANRIRKRRHRRGLAIQIKPMAGEHGFYDEDVTRGCELNKLMRQSIEDPRYPATGTDIREVETAGWNMVDSQSININHRYSQDVMEKLKIPPTTDKSWTFIYWRFEKFSETINPNSGKGYRMGGYYSNAYNCDAGMMLALSNNNPRLAQENPIYTTNMIPKLNKWSDINALSWQKVCGNKPLYYLLRSHVNNDETRDVLRLSVGVDLSQNKNLGSYPGSTFSPNTREGLALLGSPNGRGGAFMVSQHKSLFGATTQVTKISAWGPTQDPDMLFEFGTSEDDVPSEKVDPNTPYDYPGQDPHVPCFSFDCVDLRKRLTRRERAKL